ncbi:hypothetical protein P8605_12815 [Streptomyces sp. T-3]|nr:hypothetical protein [Streptomyces sp. T-3]
MTMTSGPLSAAPLDVLFTGAVLADLERIRQAADTVDAACASGPVVWQWSLDHAVFPGAEAPGVPVILLAEIPLYDADSDWLGLEFDVEWTEDGTLNVCVAVGLACWCEVNHGTHYVDSFNPPVSESTSLGDAFEAAAAKLIRWLAGPRGPEWWRTLAALPSPGVG